MVSHKMSMVVLGYFFYILTHLSSTFDGIFFRSSSSEWFSHAVCVCINAAIVFNQPNFYHKYIDISLISETSGFGLILIAIVLCSSNVFVVSVDRFDSLGESETTSKSKCASKLSHYVLNKRT